MEEKSHNQENRPDGYLDLEESEPYLGPAWAVVVLILYILKQAFPAEQYSLFWWFQMYVVALVVAVTAFTLVKRHQFYRSEKRKRQKKTTAKK